MKINSVINFKERRMKMKKFVLALVMTLVAGSFVNIAYAVEQSPAMAGRRQGRAEAVSDRMGRRLELTAPQAMQVLELNQKYDYLLEREKPQGWSDKQYRKAWNSYERKLRKVLTTRQYTLYLSHRAELFAVASVRRGSSSGGAVTLPAPFPRRAIPMPDNKRRENLKAPSANNKNNKGRKDSRRTNRKSQDVL